MTEDEYKAVKEKMHERCHEHLYGLPISWVAELIENGERIFLKLNYAECEVLDFMDPANVEEGADAFILANIHNMLGTIEHERGYGHSLHLRNLVKYRTKLRFGTLSHAEFMQHEASMEMQANREVDAR